KRVDSGELLLIESTGITNGNRPSLHWAKSNAEIYLDEKTTTFAYAVDIKRAREVHIRPLPSNVQIDAEPLISDNAPVLPQVEAMPNLPPL
ncbi:hypothetical protein ABTB86_19620, partial [Acinetobacter baumannii]